MHAADEADKHGPATTDERTDASFDGVDARSAAAGAGGHALIRITINLTPRAIHALNTVCRASGDSRTDTVNRAIGVLAAVEEIAARNNGSLVVVLDNGDNERIPLL
jgi:hypothetical protein